LLGTFLVRSGVLTSVHAFATDPARGAFILGFLVVVTGASLALYAWRAPQLGLAKIPGAFTPASREAMLLANNVLLLVAMLAVMLGTLYPLFLDALNLGKISVGPPYFDAVFYPLMAPALFLMAVGPIAAWRNATLPDLWTRLKWALGAAIGCAVITPFLMGKWTPLIALGLLLAFWIIAASVAGIVHRVRSTAGEGVFTKLRANSASYYGMHLAHIGMAVLVIGIALVRGYETERDVRMTPGESVTEGGYTFKFVSIGTRDGPNFDAIKGVFEVSKNGRVLHLLYPEKRTYFASGQTMTEAAIDSGITRDLYVSLGEPVETAASGKQATGAWAVRIYVKPFIDWIWAGCILMALGGVFAIADKRYRVRVRQPVPQPLPSTAAAATPASKGPESPQAAE
jgi:cytochrome c-type biogenesis protein CcmF